MREDDTTNATLSMYANQRSNDPYADYGTGRGWSGAGQPTGADTAMFTQVLGGDILRGTELLDIGFGDGRLLNWARGVGANAAGVERQASLIAGARAAGFRVEESVDAFPQSSFDVVTAFDVLEHIERNSLSPLLNRIATALKPGGMLVVRVPNCQVPAGWAIQMSDHTHLTPLSWPLVHRLFDECGLVSISVRGAPETIGLQVSFQERLRFALVPAVYGVRKLLLRMLGLGRDVPLAHNIIVTGRKPTKTKDTAS